MAQSKNERLTEEIFRSRIKDDPLYKLTKMAIELNEEYNNYSIPEHIRNTMDSLTVLKDMILYLYKMEDYIKGLPYSKCL